jgi:hypothetical protein
VCAKCGGNVAQLTLGIPRHQARELLELRLLPGEAEAVFHSTRDDLGWQVTGWVCARCQRFAPGGLKHRR